MRPVKNLTTLSGPNPLVCGMYVTEILTIDTDATFNEAVQRASFHLKQGELVGMPTETVYGLAANALDASAVGNIFRTKDRPANNPLIVHIFGTRMALECIRAWTPEMEKLATAFWPGPLTMVTWKSEKIPDEVTAGGKTVGIRWPWHPFFQKVIRNCGFPVAAPSANPANFLSPTTAEHVLSGLSGKIPLIVDGGASAVGLESTVVDLTVNPPRILRPGMISADQIASVLGLDVSDMNASSGLHEEKPEAPSQIPEAENENKDETVLKSPGQLSRHYSPKADLRIWSWCDKSEFNQLVQHLPYPPESVHVLFYSNAPSTEFPWARVVCFPEDPEAYARAFYAELHRADQMGAQCIILEEPPNESAWEAIRDRLKRAGSWKSF